MSQDTDPLTASPRSLVGRAEAFCKKGDDLFNQCDWEGATECYRSAVALGSDHPEAWALLVGTLYRRAHARPDVPAYQAETLAACEEALRLNPDCSSAGHFRMRTLQDLGRQEEAYRLHERTKIENLTGCLHVLKENMAAQEPRGDLSVKLLFLNALLTHAFGLFKAYAQERQGEPIEWEDDLSDPA